VHICRRLATIGGPRIWQVGETAQPSSRLIGALFDWLQSRSAVPFNIDGAHGVCDKSLSINDELNQNTLRAIHDKAVEVRIRFDLLFRPGTFRTYFIEHHVQLLQSSMPLPSYKLSAFGRGSDCVVPTVTPTTAWASVNAATGEKLSLEVDYDPNAKSLRYRWIKRN
jgi:hypothetical protein